MKTSHIIIFVFFCFSMQGFAQKIQFKKTKYNFGSVTEGDTVLMNYELRNVGESSLIIYNYEVECNCTFMEKVITAIEPGESYTIKILFDTHEKYGRQERSVIIISNAENSPSKLK